MRLMEIGRKMRMSRDTKTKKAWSKMEVKERRDGGVEKQGNRRRMEGRLVVRERFIDVGRTLIKLPEWV